MQTTSGHQSMWCLIISIIIIILKIVHFLSKKKKAQTLSLKPGEGYSGVWHKEGMTEGVAGVAVLYVVSVAA